MIKCPFCHFENEDGALFCERCTSDLTSVAAKPVPPPPPVVPAIPVAHPMDLFSDAPMMAEAVPFGALDAEPIDAIPLAPIGGTPLGLEPMPMAFDAIPVVPAVAPLDLMPPPPPPKPVVQAVPVPAPAPLPVAPAPVHVQETAGAALPPNSQPKLLVLRGQKRNVEYPIFEGLNFIGRADEKPVDIDLEEQEPPDRIWCSRQHACISWENGQLAVEDLNSANGTYVNRTRVYPGQKRSLSVSDVVQIGNVQMKVIV